MGLDMYLNRKTYVKNWDFKADQERYEVSVTLNGEPIPMTNVTEVSEEVAYWRKANAIHGWFVANVQGGKDDCGSYEVNREQLAGLVTTCEKVLAAPAQALDLLPPQGGFFFGSTDVDEGYFADLRDTVRMLKPVLAEPQPDPDSLEVPRHWPPFQWFEYHSSW